MNSRAKATVNDRRLFTFTEIINGLFRRGSHCAGMTAQFVRPDIRQSCILLDAVSSRASHNPTTRSTTAMARPAIAPRRLPAGSGSVIEAIILAAFDAKFRVVQAPLTSYPLQKITAGSAFTRQF